MPRTDKALLEALLDSSNLALAKPINEGKTMNPIHPVRLFICVAFLAAALNVQAQTTAFTYQGHLIDTGVPANGTYDLQFTLTDAATSGTTVAGPTSVAPVGVTNGLFTVQLDFGASAFNGNARWLAIGVRTNGSSAAYTTLAPLQAVTSSPYAIQALNATTAASANALNGELASYQLAGAYVNGLTLSNPGNSFTGNGSLLTSLNASQLASGTVPNGQLSGTYSSVLTLNNAGNSFAGNGGGLTSLNASQLTSGTVPNGQLSGTYSGVLTLSNPGNSFTGNGSALTSLNASQLTSGTVPTAALANIWQLGGNSGTIAGTQFLGTLDNQALEFHVNNNRALRLEPNTNGAPNVIGGAQFNFVAAGRVGATIGGGGATNYLFSPFTNSILSDFGTIGGGAGNTIQANASESTIGGGYENTIQNSGSWSTIGGGYQNTIQTNVPNSTIGGGFGNTIETFGPYSTIGGGNYNTIQGGYSVIGGGVNNTILALSFESTISGGYGNTIQTNAQYSTIAGGRQNTIQTNASYSTIGGGYANVIQFNAQCATVPGGSNNFAGGNYSFAAGLGAQSTNNGAFVWADSTGANFGSTGPNQFLIRAAGGVGIGKNNPATTLDVNGTVTATSFAGSGANLTGLNASSLSSGALGSGQLSGTYSSVLTLNNAGNSFTGNGSALTSLNASQLTSGTVPTAALGNAWQLDGNSGTTPGNQFIGTSDNQPLEFRVNNSQALRLEPNTNGAPNVIAGSPFNFVAAGTVGASIGGGGATNYLGSAFTNSILGNFGTIGGGVQNTIQTNASVSTIGGGSVNTIQTNAQASTIGGGSFNTIQTNATYSTIGGGYANIIQTSAFSSTIGGGIGNTIQTNGQNAVIPGGQNNVATNFAFAAGYNAQATNTGAFVWSDGNGTATGSAVANSVTMRASGGFTFLTGTGVGGASLAAGGTSWTTISDRNAKKNFQAVDSADVLEKLAAIPVQHWNYKWEPDNAVPHLGPVAQDFKAAFYPGRDDKSISTLEFDGVELAAIQGLNQKLEAETKAKDAEIQTLRQQNDSLATRLNELEAAVKALVEKK